MHGLANSFADEATTEPTPVTFFKYLESTYISDLIDEVRIKVKHKNTEGDISFRELSEGEQQLLTVLGLMRLTKEEETLFLLDEPDTHLNPIWKLHYFDDIKKVIGKRLFISDSHYDPRSPDDRESEKRSDVFPLFELPRAQVSWGAAQLETEAIVLIDPITDEARLISFEMDEEDCCTAVPAGEIDGEDLLKAEKTCHARG